MIGAGRCYEKRLWREEAPDFQHLIRQDFNPSVKPDVVSDLENITLPFKDSTFDELHAYEVLEHIGKQGDWKFFFAEFDEFARILKPNGLMMITAPHARSKWLWGDPGHTRYVGPEQITFLVREQYDLQEGKTAMTDYRPYFKSNWQVLGMEAHGDSNFIMLQSLKED